MTVTVRFFALGRELAGTGDAALELENGATVEAALAVLLARFPDLSQLSRFTVAVNLAVVDRDAVLADGDELALIPPVSGG